MNIVVLTGRLTKEPDLRVVGGKNTNVCDFTLAVELNHKMPNSDITADFINCQAWGKKAEFVKKYFHKGMLMFTQGEIRTSSYTNKDGKKVYLTKVSCDLIQFGESKSAAAHAELPDNIPDEEPEPEQPKRSKMDEHTHPLPINNAPVQNTSYDFDAGEEAFMNIPDTDDSEVPFA